jgi:hypothetical protein
MAVVGINRLTQFAQPGFRQLSTSQLLYAFLKMLLDTSGQFLSPQFLNRSDVESTADVPLESFDPPGRPAEGGPANPGLPELPEGTT